jgi:hypothetical protein
MDGHLTKTRGGKKGQIRPMIRFCVSFSAARVTSGFAKFGIRWILHPRLGPVMDSAYLGQALFLVYLYDYLYDAPVKRWETGQLFLSFR